MNGSAALSTSGDNSHGIVAQSVGGGGGAAIINPNSFAVSNPPSGGSAGGGTLTVPLTLIMGGMASTGGDGGTVNVTQSSSINTTGDAAYGILAQSVGGGGGLGGSATPVYTVVDVEIAQSGGASGSGGDVTVKQTGGSINTSGAGSIGIMAQSVGGGGGIGGSLNCSTAPCSWYADYYVLDFVSLTNTGGDGDGGSVTVQNNASITTTGDYAHGIVAQSVGGGGGLVGTGDGTSSSIALGGFKGTGGGGAIIVNRTGDISASGVGSVAVLAQSVGEYDQGSNIAVTLAGAISGGQAVSQGPSSDTMGPGFQGAGVYISGGNNNTLTLSSGSLSAQSGWAIITTGQQNLAITNNGAISGSVRLTKGNGQTNSFTNNAGATFSPARRSN